MARQVTMEMDYLLYLPKDYDPQEKKWPLIIFLHGAGERGDDLNKVKAHGPAKLVEQGRNFPFIIASPQCPTDKWWPNRIEHVMALIDEIIDTYNVDENRIYLTGLSMGGFGTWTIACTYPERFAAIAPICGGGQPYQARNLKNLPVWAFHGAKDPVVPVQRSQEMVDAVKANGDSAKLTVYPGVGHDSWTQTYNNDELYEWLLSHSRKQN
ncbi:MAG: prolyl oligopeptidase family serine peptidase [Deltaproteobacteria bacterium]|nr:prolyl oligopeptidase family serine peptidase [Deltaproteobacteria bacterium]